MREMVTMVTYHDNDKDMLSPAPGMQSPMEQFRSGADRVTGITGQGFVVHANPRYIVTAVEIPKEDLND